ncbi:MAG: HEPN domain-containing protein [Elainellaceae cyanobacterium]
MTPVDILYTEYLSIVGYLNENSQPSLSSDVNKYFKKVIILSAASYFEHRIQEILVEFIVKKTNNHIPALNFFKKKAIGMQYHTYFSWGEKNNPDKPGKNANTFFSLFGDDFKKQVEERLRQSQDLTIAMKAFLEVGHLRNILIHSNFAAYDFDNKTTEDVVDLYKSGLPFVTFIEELLLG